MKTAVIHDKKPAGRTQAPLIRTGGMTLLDRFAIQAMGVINANLYIHGCDSASTGWDHYSRECYALAESMLRSKKKIKKV